MEIQSAVGGIRNELAQMDRELPLSEIRTMEQIAGHPAADRASSRAGGYLRGDCAGARGHRNIRRHRVFRRPAEHEFGLRIALGARNRDLLWLVLTQGLRLAAIGIVLGARVVVGTRAAFAKFAVRSRCARSGDFSDGGPGGASRGSDRVLHSGEARDRSGSDDLAPGGMIRGRSKNNPAGIDYF